MTFYLHGIEGCTLFQLITCVCTRSSITKVENYRKHINHCVLSLHLSEDCLNSQQLSTSDFSNLKLVTVGCGNTVEPITHPYTSISKRYGKNPDITYPCYIFLPVGESTVFPEKKPAWLKSIYPLEIFIGVTGLKGLKR